MFISKVLRKEINDLTNILHYKVVEGDHENLRLYGNIFFDK